MHVKQEKNCSNYSYRTLFHLNNVTSLNSNDHEMKNSKNQVKSIIATIVQAQQIQSLLITQILAKL